MAEFDPTQSSVQYGESLLASQQKERGKWKNRSRKIKTFKKVLGAIGVADMILTKRQQRKLGDFNNNWAAEKAQAINRINQASQFNNKELAALRGYDVGLDFSDPDDWKVEIERDKITGKERVVGQGPIYNAINQQQAAAIRKSKYGLGVEGDIPKGKQEEYHDLVKEASLRTLAGLKAKYAKHSPSLYKDKDLVSAEYKRMGQEAAKQILSARNTSSIRKILDKFGIADDIDPSLEQVKLGGVNLYFDKTLKEEYDERNRLQFIAEKEYKELLKEKDKNILRVERNYIKSGLGNKESGLRTKYPEPVDLAARYNIQSKNATASNKHGYSTSNQNPMMGNLDEEEFTYTKVDGTQSVPANHLRLIRTTSGTDENPVFASWSEIQDSLLKEGRIGDLNEIQTSFYKHYGNILDQYAEDSGIESSKDVIANPKQIAEARYLAIQDLVTVGKVRGRYDITASNLTGKRYFEVEVKELAQHLQEVQNSSITSDEEKREIEELIIQGKDLGSKPRLEIKDGKQVIVDPNKRGPEAVKDVETILSDFKTQLDNTPLLKDKEEVMESIRKELTQQLPELLPQFEEIYSAAIDLEIDPEARYTTTEIESGRAQSLEQTEKIREVLKEMEDNKLGSSELRKLKDSVTAKEYKEIKEKHDQSVAFLKAFEDRFGSLNKAARDWLKIQETLGTVPPRIDRETLYEKAIFNLPIEEVNTFLDEYDYTQTVDVKKKVTEVRPVVTERTDNIRTLMTAHLRGLKKDGTKRFTIDNEEQAISNFLDVFTPATLEIESQGDYKAINKQGSGARGGFQFLGKSEKYPKGSAIAALNRLEKYLGTREWGAALREHGDASLLEPMQQTELFIGDMLEKDGSDKYMQLVFDGDMEGMIKAYEVLHHTNPDRKTKARARKIFKTYFD